jgi:exoribonuclease-2
MIEKGFIPEFPPEVERELKGLTQPASPRKTPLWRDMRNLLWVSIDNDDSRDLDQLTVAQENKIYVAVADVDALVHSGSAIDRVAHHNTTSVYTPTKNFPMLPLKLSTDLTSLNDHQDRSAIVVEMDIGKDGSFTLRGLYPAWVRNQAKLAYNGVAKWLEEGIRLEGIGNEIHEQLTLQDLLAQRIAEFRKEQGALGFATIELEASVMGDLVQLRPRVINRAHRLIENYMIAANVGTTLYLEDCHLPTLRRVVKTPKRWERIVQLARKMGENLPSKPDIKALRDFLLREQTRRPEHFYDLSLAIIKLIGRGEYMLGVPGKRAPGHFDLALKDYAHTTAPNRRYPDLIIQRLLKSHLYGEPVPYSQGELLQIAAQCTKKEDDAMKVERRLIKCAAAMMLVHQVGQKFQAMVTGASAKGTWIRLDDPAVEGRLTHHFERVDVGDRIEVELVRVDVRHGHIDFKRVGGDG